MSNASAASYTRPVKFPLGTIHVTRAEPGPFSDHHIELLKTFADQAVIAMENARLFSELQERLEEQTATSGVLEVIRLCTWNGK